jgi:hypothetical protein
MSRKCAGGYLRIRVRSDLLTRSIKSAAMNARIKSDIEHMDKRTFSRMVRRTNVDDLLDDGIDNGSDLKSFAQSDDDDMDNLPKEPQVDLPTQPRELRKQSMAKPRDAVPCRAPVSYVGLLSGAFFLIAGVLLFLYPNDIHILHDRIRGGSFVEHVTTTGSQAYAAMAVILGIAICAFSLYRPRK